MAKVWTQRLRLAKRTNIYEAFFYRGLARLPEGPRRPAWDYDYACVLALRRDARRGDAPSLGWTPPSDWEGVLGRSRHLRDDPSRTEVEAD